MMENQILPKTPIGQAYYSRQLYFYVFGVVCHNGRQATQGKNDVFFYTWLESENHKDSNMIASAIQHLLSHRLEVIKSKKVVRLFSDSCFGQNKNVNVLSMLMSNRKRLFPQTDILYTFPVRGHSYLPADRAFGRVSQDIRTRETISLPEEYVEIFEQHGQVFQYGKDWQAFDFKAETKLFLKQKRTFQISNVKRMDISGSGTKVSVSDSFNRDLCEHSLLKPGKSWANFRPSVLHPVSTVKDPKKDDVRKLLAEMGATQSVKERYEVFFNVQTAAADDADYESD